MHHQVALLNQQVIEWLSDGKKLNERLGTNKTLI